MFLYENSPEKKKIIEENFENQLEICTQINFSDYFYVPQCFVLVSKFPYIQPMHQALKSILRLSINNTEISKEKDNNTSVITNLILELIKGIPVPLSYYNNINNTSVQLHLPYIDEPITLSNLTYKELPCINYDIKTLFDTLSIDNILLVVHLMQLEQKILFVGDDYSKLTEVIEIFANLIYPLE